MPRLHRPSQQSALAFSGLGVAGVALHPMRLQRSARVSGSFVSGLVLTGSRLINPSGSAAVADKNMQSISTRNMRYHGDGSAN